MKSTVGSPPSNRFRRRGRKPGFARCQLERGPRLVYPDGDRSYHLQGTMTGPINNYGRNWGKRLLHGISDLHDAERRNALRRSTQLDPRLHVRQGSRYAHLDVVNSEKTIRRHLQGLPDDPTTNAELEKKVSRLTDFKGKLVLGSYPSG